MSSCLQIRALDNSDIDWDVIFKRVKKYSTTMVKRYNKPYLDPDDIASQVYIRLLQSNFNPHVSKYRCIYVIIRNLVLNTIRNNSRKSSRNNPGNNFVYIDHSEFISSRLFFMPKFHHSLELYDILGKIENVVIEGGKSGQIDGVFFRSDTDSLLNLMSLGYNIKDISPIMGVSMYRIKRLLNKIFLDIKLKDKKSGEVFSSN